MNVRFLADADLNVTIVRGLQRVEPTLDFLVDRTLIAASTADPDVLSLAANLGRVLVSHDQATMPAHFYSFIERRSSPGLILVPQLLPLRQVIEQFRMIWCCLEPHELANRIIYLPL